MKYILLLILLWPISAMAEQKMYVGMLSYHYDRDTDYNETHALIGYERNGYFIEVFENSKYNTTWYAGIVKRHVYDFNDNWSFGSDIGLIKGYDFHDEKVSVIGFPMITYQREKFGIDFRFGYDEVIAARFTYNF